MPLVQTRLRDPPGNQGAITVIHNSITALISLLKKYILYSLPTVIHVMKSNRTRVQYQNLKCILEHLDVMKRLDLVARFPIFQKVDKAVPLRMKTIEIHESEAVIRINEMDLEMKKIEEDAYVIRPCNGKSYPSIFPKTPFPSPSVGMDFLKSVFLEGRHLKVREFLLKSCFFCPSFQFSIEIDRLTTDSKCAQSIQRYLTSPLKRLELLLIDPIALEMDLVKQAGIVVLTELRPRDFQFPPMLANPVVVFQDLHASAARLAFFVMYWSGEERTSGQMFMRTRGRRQTEKIMNQMSLRFSVKVVDVDMKERKNIPITKVLSIPLSKVTQVVVHGLEQTLYNFNQPFLCQYVKMEIMSNDANPSERLDRIFNFFTV